MATGAIVARILTQYSDKGSKAAQRDIAKLGKNFDAFAKKATKAFAIPAALFNSNIFLLCWPACASIEPKAFVNIPTLATPVILS